MGDLGPREVLIVGDGPTEEDATLEEAFVGPEGRYLQSVITKMAAKWKGAMPSYTYTHLVLCPPRDTENFNQIRLPKREEFENCEPRLNELIQILRCRSIIAAGKLASLALNSRDLHGAKLFVIPSPSSVLAQQERGALDQARVKGTMYDAFTHAQGTRKPKKNLS